MGEQTHSTHPKPDETDNALRLLSAGIPLTLLFDLAAPVHSAEIYCEEAGRADWLKAGVA